jgi:hypothetical protein
MDQIVSTLEAALTPDLAALRASMVGGRIELFSHRHAEALHVFGASIQVDQAASDFGLLILRVAVSSMHSEVIRGEVIWFRSRQDFGTADLTIEVRGFTEESVLEFRKEWPRLITAIQVAATRKAPIHAA